MNTPIKTDEPVSDDVECGSIDAGLTESIVVRKTESVAVNVRAENEAIDPTSEINYYGVGVTKMDGN
jgi:hypothetical protein